MKDDISIYRDRLLDNFKVFISNLFNNFNFNSHLYEENTLPKEFQGYVKDYLFLGRYKDPEKRELDVLVVNLKIPTAIDRARTMQRNLVAKYLKDTGINSALVAFHGENPEDWRLSFVKLEHSIMEGGNIEEDITPARRYSFLVGKNEFNHTAQSMLVPMLLDESNILISNIEEAFSVEKVTQEFFEKYRELFIRLQEAVEKIIKKDKDVYKEFKSKGVESSDFAKKILGQIVFLYFLQKKGWLGVQRDTQTRKFKKWGEGDKNFLQNIFYKAKDEHKNFFNEYLEPLFYQALAKDRSDDEHYYDKLGCRIPFLNGGLFEPIGNYSWTTIDILIDDDLFGEIFTTFNTYNFTVKEDEPLEKEVAIDPEMLGKVFENLLKVKDRKSKGSYYTPREIVHYMCQESLINYLETGVGIKKDSIEKFIKHESSIKLPKQIEENKEKIDKLLANIKIVDPAAGSGAFLVGMMTEIIKARSALNLNYKNYKLKRDCIENSLYGVDIDPSAIDICQLRLWLSLIVDEESIEDVKPLPNLDHKIMCGNSLLEEFKGVKLFDEKLLGEIKKDNSFEIKQIEKDLDKLYKEKGEIVRGKKRETSLKEIDKKIKKLERKKQDLVSTPKANGRNLTLDEAIQNRVKESQKKLSEHQALQKQLFNEQDRNIKKKLREDIDRREWELIAETLKEQGSEKALKELESIMKSRSKPFFLWKLQFSEVFQRENPGFDVVIANPPYLEFDEIRLKDSNFVIYRDGFGMKYKFNLYSLFLKKGPNLLRQQGVMSYIVPNSFSKEKYNENIREDYINNMKLISFVDFTQEKKPIFENASNDSYVVFVIEKSKAINRHIVVNKYLDKIFYFSYKINQEDILKSFDFQFNISINSELVQKIEKKKNSFELGKICLIRVGLTPSKSYKRKYGDDYETFFERHKQNKSLYKLLRRNKKEDICDRYRIKHKTDYIVWDREQLYADKVCPGEFEDYYNPKLIFRNRGNAVLGSIDTENIFVNDIFNVVVLKSDYKKERVNTFEKSDILLASKFDLEYLLAVINSSLINFYLWNAFVFRDIKAPMMKKFPIKNISENQQKPFIRLVNQILSITKDNDYLENPDKQAKVKKLEKEIDALVYKLYELTPEEIKIVEDFCDKK